MRVAWVRLSDAVERSWVLAGTLFLVVVAVGYAAVDGLVRAMDAIGG